MYGIRSMLAVALAASTAVAQQQQSRIQYPAARKVDTVTNYHGTRVSDPFRWMEEIDQPEVAEWSKAQNAITLPYLASLPGRHIFHTRITSLYNYPRSGMPWRRRRGRRTR